MTDAERIAELERRLSERDAQIAERDAQIAEHNAQIAERQARIEKLQNQVKRLRCSLESWKRGHRVRAGGKLAQKRRLPSGKRPGRAKGHAGSGRHAPDGPADRTEQVPSATVCPFCDGEVEATDEEPGVQWVEELIPARVERVAYHRHKGRCVRCRKPVLAALPDGLGENPKVGVIAQAEIIERKTELGLTVGQTQKLFASQGLHLSRGGIQQILHRGATVMKPGVEQIQASIVHSAVAWADESPHKIEGQSGYLWLVMTRVAVLFVADRSRSGAVIRRILKGFTGILHSDFYAAYWTLEGIGHAPCWAHLCRTARTLAERTNDRAALDFSESLSALYAWAAVAQETVEGADAEALAIGAELKVLAGDARLGKNEDVARLQRRMLKHFDELLAWVTNPTLEGTNNRAEREFRLHAIQRHRSGGARSDHGAETYATNMSITRTLAAQGQNFRVAFIQARIASRGGGKFPTIVATPLVPGPEPPPLN